MPGFTFPAVGPLDVGSPPSRPEVSSGLRYYDQLRLPEARLGFLRFSLSSSDTLYALLLFVIPLLIERARFEGETTSLRAPGGRF